MRRLRRVSSNCRTMNVPVFAELFQWMNRRSSPGTYSRSAWNAMSLAVRSRVGDPSRSRMNPVLSAAMAIVRGCTCSSTVCDQTISRRMSPTGSARTVRAGPIGMMPRRSVGMRNCSSNAPPRGSPGRTRSITRPPTGTSSCTPPNRRRPGFAAMRRASACSPTTTRGVGSASSIVEAPRPMSQTDAAATSSASPQPMAMNSIQPHA